MRKEFVLEIDCDSIAAALELQREGIVDSFVVSQDKVVLVINNKYTHMSEEDFIEEIFLPTWYDIDFSEAHVPESEFTWKEKWLNLCNKYKLLNTG